MVLIEQQHDSQVTQSFVAKSRAGDELQTLDLTKMSWITEHVDVEQLSDVIVSRERIILLEGGANRSRFLLDDGALIGKGLYA